LGRSEQFAGRTDELQAAAFRPPPRQGRLSLRRAPLDAIDRLPTEAGRGGDLCDPLTLAESPLHGLELLPREAGLPAPVGVLPAPGVVYAGPLGLLNGLRPGLRRGRHEADQGVPHGLLRRVNTALMSLHLAEISQQVAPGAHAIRVLDGAVYHDTAKTRRPRRLVVPDNITLIHLPASSPELNPMELIWQHLRQNTLAYRVFRDYQQILNACCDAWNVFANDPDLVTTITSRDWAQVNVPNP
jgi:hypothetical protein